MQYDFFPTVQADNRPIHYMKYKEQHHFSGICLQVVYHSCQTRKKAYGSVSREGMQLKDLAK